MKRTAHFRPALFQFLEELAANNTRPWFQENKARYEEHVREPLLRFISDFGPCLRKISAGYVADPRPVGGSMFRIHRDTRFSRDKSPYKTAASAQFRHLKGKDVHAPGYYLHLEPGRVFAGCGMWRPEAKAASKVRAAIVRNPRAWKGALSGKAFRATCELEGERLKRPPRGIDPEHPLIDDLKRKDFIAFRSFTQSQACSSGFLDLYVETCRSMAPLMKFLTQALGLAW